MVTICPPGKLAVRVHVGPDPDPVAQQRSDPDRRSADELDAQLRPVGAVGVTYHLH